VRTKKAAADPDPARTPQLAGSFTLDWERLSGSAPPSKPPGRKSRQWRRERERLRRMKRESGNSR
jgi:hypothetical protein